jgi:Helix-turn-helix of DDE superfamily endonuclease
MRRRLIPPTTLEYARLESIQAKVFFILFYFKCYPTFDVLSIIFDLERGRSNRWVHRLQGILG